MVIAYFVSFFLAGLIQEILIVFYHRAIATHRILAVSILSTLIAAMGLLVFAEVTRKIFDPAMHTLSVLFVLTYAIGKGFGSYLSMRWLLNWSCISHEKRPE